MELMNWFIKPFNKSMIWLGETGEKVTFFGIKVYLIIFFVITSYTVFILTDAIYEKGFKAGVKSSIEEIEWLKIKK